MMDYFWQGSTYGLAIGALAWIGGWAAGKIFKLFQYVAR
jgi:hypothetical protein